MTCFQTPCIHCSSSNLSLPTCFTLAIVACSRAVVAMARPWVTVTFAASVTVVTLQAALCKRNVILFPLYILWSSTTRQYARREREKSV